MVWTHRQGIVRSWFAFFSVMAPFYARHWSHPQEWQCKMIPDSRNGCLGFDHTRRTSRTYGCLHWPVLCANPLGLPVIGASNLQRHRVRIISGPIHRNPVQEHHRPGYSLKRNPIIIPPTGSFRSEFDGVIMQPAPQPSRI